MEIFHAVQLTVTPRYAVHQSPVTAPVSQCSDTDFRPRPFRFSVQDISSLLSVAFSKWHHHWVFAQPFCLFLQLDAYYLLQICFLTHQTVTKANRAPGVLIRSYQRATPGGHLNVSPVVTSYLAYVWSNLEYCSVFWNGAATVHADRVGRVEHEFLTWLNAHCRCCSPSLSYVDLLKHLKLSSVSARRSQHDVMFILNVFNRRILSESLSPVGVFIECALSNN